MTADEIADEIYVGFWYLTNDSRIAKQCALICVDEKIHLLSVLYIKGKIDEDDWKFYTDELINVRQEIIKL